MKRQILGKFYLFSKRNLAIFILAAVLSLVSFHYFVYPFRLSIRAVIGRAIPSIRYPPVRQTTISVDDRGIAITHYGPPIGDRRNPVSVCQKSFRFWEKSMSFPAGDRLVDPEARRYFFNCANWLLEHGVRRTDGLVWEYDWAFGDMEPPWISAMAQGHAMQALCRAYSLTREPKYYEAARAALGVFFVDVSDGGVRIIDEDSDEAWWYAEYPSRRHCRRVLNGMMFAVLGLHELYLAEGDAEARMAFGRGVNALLRHLDDYDTGKWTYYDTDKRLASEKYHRLHVNLLWRLYDVTGEEKLRACAERWAQYKPTPPPRAWGKFEVCLFVMLFLLFVSLLKLGRGLYVLVRMRRRGPACGDIGQ